VTPTHIPHMSPEEMRARTDECERLVDLLELTPGDLREMLRARKPSMASARR